MRLIIAEDQGIVREGLRRLLEALGSYEIVASARDGREAVEQALVHRPDIIMVDVVMPELDGIEATRQIIERLPAAKVVVLSMYPDYVEEAFEAGAAAYVMKDCAPDKLLDVIELVASGRRGVVAKPERNPRMSRPGNLSARLTPREQEVLRLLAKGLNTKEAAHALGLSPKTVETHRAHLFVKLGCNSVVTLTHIAISEGLIDPNKD